jgi:hypothetical protein
MPATEARSENPERLLRIMRKWLKFRNNRKEWLKALKLTRRIRGRGIRRLRVSQTGNRSASAGKITSQITAHERIWGNKIQIISMDVRSEEHPPNSILTSVNTLENRRWRHSIQQLAKLSRIGRVGAHFLNHKSEFTNYKTTLKMKSHKKIISLKPNAHLYKTTQDQCTNHVYQKPVKRFVRM